MTFIHVLLWQYEHKKEKTNSILLSYNNKYRTGIKGASSNTEGIYNFTSKDDKCIFNL